MYIPSGSVFYDTSVQYGSATGPILLSDVKCSGLEHSLTDCVHSVSLVSPCTHYYDIGIKCEGDILLIGYCLAIIILLYPI